MKQPLLWVPLVGQACWLLGYPFMKRHSRAYLEKHPEQRNKDIETTRQTCERFRNVPVTLINYVEGTRMLPEKQKRQNSPYKNLLKPRAGGIAFIAGAMTGQIDTILNVTIIYSKRRNIMWEFLQGKLSSITVHVEEIEIPAELRGNYQDNDAHRALFQQWLNDLWQKKDEYISLHQPKS